MTRSPDSLVPSASGQPDPEKRDDKALTCWQEGEANLRAATEVNAVTASSYPPAITTRSCSVSIHTPRAGRDFRTAFAITPCCVFQSTRPARGATETTSLLTLDGNCFNPHAPR